jgi:hypothetical protein
MIEGAVANVLDFGADPTGLTNSSTAFQAACATGKTVFVPKGTYQASFSLYNGQIICGEGAKRQTVIIPPTGAIYVIAITANSNGTAFKQHCQIRDLSLMNPNNVASCIAIYFDAPNVLGINDSHRIDNVYINGFLIGVYATGRMILHTYTNVEVEECRVGMQIIGDPTNYAVNLNTFIMCRWVECEQEGVRISGYNIANKFISCNVERCNKDLDVGVGGMYVENAEGLFLDNPYFELNGQLVPVDTVNPLNNSVGLYLVGDRCFNLQVLNGWFVQSGTMIAVNVAQGILGGEISGIRFLPEAGGFDIYIGDKLNQLNAQPLAISSNNTWSGKLAVKTDGAGLTSATVGQVAACQFITGNVTIDLRAANKLTTFNASAFTLSLITNRIPGMEMKIYNAGAGTVSIDASLMVSGVASTITTGVAKSYMVLGYPNAGLCVEF